MVYAGHFISETRQLTGPQCPNEGMHPAVPPPKAGEELQEGVLVPPALIGGPQSVLITGCEAGQVRQNLQNMDPGKIAVMLADILKSLVLGNRHRCPGSEVTEGSGP